MDEILIEEKRYVSSKQAAKMTGYAKDYIGQLCREGRVPARLVGRSWYVLESAIQDHRFGSQDVGVEEAVEPKEIKLKSKISSETWQFPRYEASNTEVLPSVNRLRDAESPAVGERTEEETPVEAVHGLHESWQEWFDQVAEVAPVAGAPHLPDSDVASFVEEQDEPVREAKEEVVSIPLHVMNQSLPRRELLPRSSPIEEKPVRSYERDCKGNKLFVALRVAGVFAAVVALVLAGIGTGYFDKYIISSGQAEMISGVVMYNK
ncbi:MAG: helix-turn-helix domain-containing protein [Minisyncoccia bacterium]